MPRPPRSHRPIEDEDVKDQGRRWSRNASKYDDIFLSPFREGVDNPIPAAVEAVPHPESKTAIDLGCGTGPLLPMLAERFARVYALDFAPAMLKRARERLGESAGKVTFLNRSMDDLDDLAGEIDLAVAINSVVMSDVRLIDRSLRGVHACLKPGGTFLGVVPAIDAIHYQTMLLLDRELDRGKDPEEAERLAAFHAEHHFYEFRFGRFLFRGLKQKFWQPFEVQYRLKKAGFSRVKLGQVLYPWDDQMTGGKAFADQPRSWDWSFEARA